MPYTATDLCKHDYRGYERNETAMTEMLIIGIKCLAAILAGVFAGNGAVYVFNKIPAAWLCDYGEKPSAALTNPYNQRVKSYPWKFLFTMLFVILGIKLVMDDWRFAIAALCCLWLLLEMAIADSKYRIVPDQFVLLTAVTALGFIPFHGNWTDCLYGGLAGFGVMTFTALLGKMAYRRESVGGGDIKLFSALGLIMGLRGILIVFALTALLSAVHLIWLLARKRIKRQDQVPMVPYIAISAGVYLVFLWDGGAILQL